MKLLLRGARNFLKAGGILSGFAIIVLLILPPMVSHQSGVPFGFGILIGITLVLGVFFSWSFERVSR